MKDKYFIDTNIFVYAHDSNSKMKREASQKLIMDGIKDELAVISTQVLSEFFVVITKKVQKPLPQKTAKKEIELLRCLEIVEINIQTILSSIDLHVESKVSFRDSLIIVCAQNSNCKYVFSEDLNPGQKFNGVEIINPFK